MRYRTLHYYAEGALKGLRTDTLGNVTPASYAILLGSFSFGSMSCLVEKGLLTPIAIAFRSSLVVGQINKIQPPQSRTPRTALSIVTN